MRNDLVVVIRGLARTPVFTLVSVLTLAIALGGTTAISSFVRGILLALLPVGARPQSIPWRRSEPSS